VAEGSDNKILPTSFWLDVETRALLDALTAELEMSRSAVVREAIRQMGADDKRQEIRRVVRDLEKLVSGR
jgi:predicted transcriptional regulator